MLPGKESMRALRKHAVEALQGFSIDSGPGSRIRGLLAYAWS